MTTLAPWVLLALGACVVPDWQRGGGLAYGSPSPEAQAQAPATAPSARRIEINGRPITAQGLRTVAALEASSGGQLPDGSYWYDGRSGALGRWGGPTLTVIPAGLELGAPLPANASGGGSGRVTGVFINGRELHPMDVQLLSAFIGSAIFPGRYWVDAQANAGLEGGPPMWNLYVLAQRRQQQQSGGGNGGPGKYGIQTGPNGCVAAPIHHLGGTYSNYMSPSC
jgi:hypothetical protein